MADAVDHELERRLLAATFDNPDTHQDVADVLGECEPWTLDGHRVVWQAMCNVLTNGDELDEVALLTELTPAQRDYQFPRPFETPTGLRTGMMSFVQSLRSAAPLRTQTKLVAQKVREVAERRLLMDTARDAWHMLAQGEDADTVAALLTEAATKPMQAKTGVGIAVQFSQWLEERMEGASRYSTGISPIDAVVSFEPGMHNVMGGLSGHGKTTGAAVMAAGLLHNHDDLMVDWWSCEVPVPLMVARLLAAWSTNFNRKPYHEHHARHPANAPEAWARANVEAMGWLNELDKSGRVQLHDGTIDARKVAMRVAARRRRYPDRPYLVVVDYLQRVAVPGTDSSVERVGTASTLFADMATQHNCMTLVLSQFTTTSSVDPIPMPRPGQARWSKDTENDAANFLVWHRPWKHSEKDSDIVILQQAKSRYGSLGHVVLKGCGATNKLESSNFKPNVPGLTTGEL